MVNKQGQKDAYNSKTQRKDLNLGDGEDLRERRYLWTARAFTFVFVVSLCANIVLIIVILNMIPLARTEPFLLTFQDKSEQIMQVKQMLGLKDKDIVSDAYVRQYVVLRNTVTPNVDEMSLRWGPDGPIKWMSSDLVYADFVSKNGELLEQMRKDGLTRDVDIISVNKLSPDIWQAEIETKDLMPHSPEPSISRWTILLRVGYSVNARVKHSQRLKNPLGFTVFLPCRVQNLPLQNSAT